MPKTLPSKDEILDAIRQCAKDLGRSPSRPEFKKASGFTEYMVTNHFPNWSSAVKAAGLQPHLMANQPVTAEQLLEDWATIVRQMRQIPTREQYRHQGNFNVATFDKKGIGPWKQLPHHFRKFAESRPQWIDVLALLPPEQPSPAASAGASVSLLTNDPNAVCHRAISDRPTYGNPIDFRGLRHEPVNENGVVFLFGMVAREWGYMVEAVQAAYPDCEAKRQVTGGRWQRVRIEFEFESRNFRDHGHSPDGCDVIICWRHNWQDCPANIEVVELQTVLQSLAKSQD